MNLEKLKSEFKQKYGANPRIFRAPGRVNLIGEHTDYNEGFVMPCAIDLATYVAGSVRDDRKIRVASRNFEGELEFDLDDPNGKIKATWAKYVQGVAFVLEKSGFRLGGANLLIESDLPIGAGLSSSAALGISTAFALAALSKIKLEKWDLAKIGQIAENEFAGVRSGIMDQFASVFGLVDHALFLDCRSLNWSPIPLFSAQFIICNTKKTHDLADGEYNKRRADCEEAAAILGHASLRDVTSAEFKMKAAALPERLRKRARHVLTENLRVMSAVKALQNGDLPAFGKLMNESHESLRCDYEVSTEELDLMVGLAREQNGVLGTRMMGGGFGGCTINLLENKTPPDFVDKISANYQRITGITPEIYLCKVSNGVSELK